MNSELQIVARFIEKAKCPEDVFGAIPGTSTDERLESLTAAYKKLARATFPEAFIGDKESYDFAGPVFAKLADMRKQAAESLKKGQYGRRNGAAVPPAGQDSPVLVKDTYVRFGALAAGDIADIHLAYFERDGARVEAVIKAARDAADNELLAAEHKALSAIRKFMGAGSKNNAWLTCIPESYDSFLMADGFGKRRVNVLERFDEFLTCEEIRGLLPGGVDGRTVAWMWKRLLGLLDWTHKAGFLHGAVLPPHVMYFPDRSGLAQKDLRKHSVRLVDWCYSAELKSAAKLKAWCPQYEAFYAPEILAKRRLGPQTDLYMGAKTMLYILGGNVNSNTFPSRIPKELADSLRPCLEKDPARRPSDLMTYFDRFTAVLLKLYGPPKYHEFIVPAR